jgi:single-strand DNA-binding protein
MNVISLTGRATDDCRLRYTQSGKGVANGTIAVQRKFKNAQGDYEADFINFTAWGKAGELIAEYVKKGQQFGISGELQSRVWEKDDGTKVKMVEVNVNQFDFPPKPKGNQQQKDKDLPLNEQKDPFKKPGNWTPDDVPDSELPF